MTEKELKNLSPAELINMISRLQQDNESLLEENDQIKRALSGEKGGFPVVQLHGLFISTDSGRRLAGDADALNGQQNGWSQYLDYPGAIHLLQNGGDSPQIALQRGTIISEEPKSPEDSHYHEVYIRTFGYFDVFVDGKPISFTHEKSKEMMAVLVDRKGGFVSSSEMVGYLWEDDPFNKTTQSRCRQVASRLKKTLKEYGVGYIIENVNGLRRIVPEKVVCDYFQYVSNRPEYRHLFTGAYMLNYSWSEMTTANLENSRENR